MRETPRPRVTTGDTGSAPPQLRSGRALAHTTGASGSGTLHRSDGRPPHTPRGARYTDRDGRSGTSPPVPERPASFRPFPRLLLSALCALLFGVVTWQVAAGGPLRAADERLGRAMADPDGPASALFELFADLGHTHVALPVLAVATVCAARLGGRAHTRVPGGSRRWLPPLAAWLAMAAVPLLVVPLKAATARPGPDGLPVAAGEGFYPSGHTATAAVAHGSAALLLLPLVRRASARLALAAAVPLLQLCVGAGLVRRGYHWPLDVLGSWLLSGLLLWALAGGLRRARASGHRPHAAGPARGVTDRPRPPG